MSNKPSRSHRCGPKLAQDGISAHSLPHRAKLNATSNTRDISFDNKMTFSPASMAFSKLHTYNRTMEHASKMTRKKHNFAWS